MNPVLESLRGRLVVSCQAYDGEPMLDPRTMTQVAQSAVIGGAAAIRAKGLDDLRAMRPVIDVPIIGAPMAGRAGGERTGEPEEGGEAERAHQCRPSSPAGAAAARTFAS